MSTPNEKMRHALGVQEQGYGNRWSKPYRNHFVAGGDDVAVWRELVRGGLAVLVSEGNEHTGGDPVFAVSFLGQSHALAGLTFKRVWGYGKPVNP
jgi:hypothetical protein